MGGTPGSELARFQPLIHRSLGLAGSGEMMRQELGLALHYVGELLFQHRRRAGVQFLPSGTQQGAVGDVLQQRMLEQVRRVRICTAVE